MLNKSKINRDLHGVNMHIWSKFDNPNFNLTLKVKVN